MVKSNSDSKSRIVRGEQSLQTAIADLAAGRMILVVDDAEQPRQGEVCVAAQLTTPEHIGFMAVHARGLVCLAVLPPTLLRLGIPLMPADRAATIRVAIDERSGPADIVMPGHVPPIQVAPGGTLERPGRIEAALDVVRLAALRAAATVCTVLDREGEVARGTQLIAFARKHKLKMVSVDAVIRHRLRSELLVERLDERELDSAYGGKFRAIAYRNKVDDSEHMALVRGRPRRDEAVLVRVHSQCLTGDVLGSRRCDCGEQLEAAVRMIAEAGRGVLVYLHQEGRGIGLANKIRAYALQDRGLDTVEANLELGFTDDPRDYGISAQILRDLGISSVKLLTNNSRKISGLTSYGIEVTERVPIEALPHALNIGYLRTKRAKLGHILTGLETGRGA